MTSAVQTEGKSYLKDLEAESIEILREVAASFRNPVLMYSIGKDSSVLLHLARKAFYPSPVPFPVLHVDTTWKFREMIAFRNQVAKELAADAAQRGARATLREEGPSDRRVTLSC